MCAVAAGKHIHRKVILGDLSGTACLDGQQTWRSHWYQKHHNDRAGRIVLFQSFSSTWCLHLRKEDKAEVLLSCKHPSLVLHTQITMPGQTEISAELPTAQSHQHHLGIPTGFASWAGVCRLAISACCGVYPCCCQGIITQM